MIRPDPQPQQAIVYKGAHRRYFRRKTALMSIAREAIRRHCECDLGDAVTPPYCCEWHLDHDRASRLVKYLVERWSRKP